MTDSSKCCTTDIEAVQYVLLLGATRGYYNRSDLVTSLLGYYYICIICGFKTLKITFNNFRHPFESILWPINVTLCGGLVCQISEQQNSSYENKHVVKNTSCCNIYINLIYLWRYSPLQLTSLSTRGKSHLFPATARTMSGEPCLWSSLIHVFIDVKLCWNSRIMKYTSTFY